MKTTIQLNSGTLERLRNFKKHERETYDFVLNNLMDDVEDDILTDEDIEGLKLALEEVKRGETVSFEEVLKARGITLD